MPQFGTITTRASNYNYGRMQVDAADTAQHGSTERGRARPRSRERGEGSLSPPMRTAHSQPPPNIRIRTVGPQETADWLEALDNFSNRMETVERALRLHGQTIGTINEQHMAQRDDYAKYKRYVEITFQNIHKHIETKVEGIGDKMQEFVSGPMAAGIQSMFDETDAKVKVLDAMVQSLAAHVNHAAAQHFDIAGQVTPPPGVEPDPMRAEGGDPWARRTLPPPVQPGAQNNQPDVSSPFLEHQGGQANPFSGEAANQPTVNVPAPPRSFQSPFASNRAAVSTPLGPDPRAQPQPRAQGAGYTSMPSYGNVDISQKPNEALRKFDGDSAKYKMWSDRMKDHMASGNTAWKNILKPLERATNPITRQWLEDQWIDGMPAWLLAEKLETFMCRWVNDTIYGQRTQLCGGEAQSGNGFEFWRQLFMEHHGGEEAIQLGGIRRLQEWPKCNSLSNLKKHLADWQECLETHNKELLSCPTVIRSMLMGIIPTEYEDEILVRPEIVSYKDIIEFCNRRTTYRRQKQLVELARKPPHAKVNALVEVQAESPVTQDAERVPSWAQTLIHAIGQSVPPPPKPNGARPPKGDRSRDRGRSPGGSRDRTPSPNGRRAFNMKFRYNGCWHCGKAGHSRKANPAKGIKGCPEFDQLKSRNGGAPPTGYKGAYEKARDAAWEKAQSKKKESSKVNMLADTDDDDDSDLDSVTHGGIFALRSRPAPFAHDNPFAGLSEDDDDVEDEISDDMISQFSRWAKVRKAKKPKKVIQIASIKQLEDHVANNDNIKKLPDSTKKLKKMLKKLPEDIELANDEVLALIDTGSHIHAADVDVHFPDYVNHVRESSAQRRGATATTAGGHQLSNKGKFTVSAIAGDHQVKIPFNNMKVQLPILSVREMMDKESSVLIEDDTGVISNKKTQQSINFVVRDGLWFMKLKVRKPDGSPAENDSGFGRPGP